MFHNGLNPYGLNMVSERQKVNRRDYEAFEGVNVTLDGNQIWDTFNKIGTEMVITKNGR